MRRLAVLLVAAVALLLGAGRAGAHAELASTEPADGAVLDAGPDRIVLRFTEHVDTVPGGIRVLSADGAELEIGAAGRLAGDGSTVTASAPALGDGIYVVTWRVVSADGHPIEGAYSFQVGADVAGEDPDAVAALLSEGTDTRSSDLLLGVGRFAGYVGIAVLVGSLTVAATIVPPSRRMQNVAWGALSLGILGTLAMLGGQAAAALGRGIGAVTDPDGWQAVLESRAGSWWAARGTVLVAAALVVSTLDRARTAAWRASAGLTCGVLLWAVAAGGHAITGRAVAAGMAATMVHVAAMSVWLGGLVALVVSFPGQRPQRSLDLVRRFSPVALVAMLALVASGLVNALRQVDAASELTSTSYGRILLAKTGLVVVSIAVAATARRMVRGRLLGAARRVPVPVSAGVAGRGGVAAAGGGGAGAERAEPGRTQLVRTLGVEVALGVVILAVTAGLVDSTPPAAAGEAVTAAVTGEAVTAATVPSSAGADDGAEQPEPGAGAATPEGRRATVTVDPAQPGQPLSVRVTVEENSVEDPGPDEIRLQVSLPERDISPIDLDVEPAGPGEVVASGVVLPAPGRWLFEVIARYGEFEQTIIPVTVDVD